MDDLFALLTGDLCPIIGIGRIRQIFMLLVLFADRTREVVHLQAFLVRCDRAFDGKFLRARDNPFDQRTARKVLEVERLLLSIGVRDLQEFVFLRHGIHGLSAHLYQAFNQPARIPPVTFQLRLGKWQIFRHILSENVSRGGHVGPRDLDLDVEAASTQDSRVDEVLPVTGPNDDDVAQPLDTIDLRQKLRHDRRLDIRGHAGPPSPK